VAVALQHPFARRRAIPIAQVAAEPLIGLTREDYPNYYDYLSIIFFEGETETAGGGGARQFFRHYVGRRSGNRRRHWCRRFWSQFRKPSKAFAPHS